MFVFLVNCSHLLPDVCQAAVALHEFEPSVLGLQPICKPVLNSFDILLNDGSQVCVRSGGHAS